ncbi:DNA-methyltransferase [Chryseomicrobium aureum]|uniref:DNA-methyltransferase n=1 Tax=Chryseomicrobium aureum TaxID=1441723 RepID=UPI00370D40B4
MTEVNIENEIVLYNADCLQTLKKLEDNSVDLVLTDPPYNLGNFMRDRQTNLKKMRDNFFGDAGWDDLGNEEWKDSMDILFKEISRVLKKKGSVIMFMSLIRVETIVELAARHKFYYKTTGIWHKKNPMPRNMNLHFINSTEGWLYFINDGKTGTYNNEGKVIHDFIETSVTPGSEKKFGSHPTQKPEALFEHFIDLLTNENDTVLDPFMGSGTAGVVAKRRGRNFIGCELESDYYEGALKRITSEQKSLVLNNSSGVN